MQPVVLLLDTSGSMREDDKIDVLNDSVTEMPVVRGDLRVERRRRGLFVPDLLLDEQRVVTCLDQMGHIRPPEPRRDKPSGNPHRRSSVPGNQDR